MKPVVDSPHPTLRASRMGPPGKGRQPDTKCHQMFHACKSRFFSIPHGSVPIRTATDGRRIPRPWPHQLPRHAPNLRATAPPRNCAFSGTRGASFGGRYLSGEPSLHLPARVAWSPFARRCAARQLVGAGEHSGKTETRWRHCALAGTDQLAPQFIFDSSAGELHACSLARKYVLKSACCLLTAKISSAARG